ncbi:MAG: hypothetical protein GF341_08420 [candidate division Zixibacteria bacterium]|nr:hypothetical protein [candidate division Zixibacteria bacterium]
MPYDPSKHHRRSIRLKGFDYSQRGAYFVTICVQQREFLFGDIVGGTMNANEAGHMVETWWLELNQKFPNTRTDEYVVMPNHFHGIITLVGADLCVCPTPRQEHEITGNPVDLPGSKDEGPAGALGAHSAAVPTIVQWFKTMTTNAYIRAVKQDRWPAFPGRLWQRNYYEHIIRDQESLNQIREYISLNPLQ